MLTKEEFTYLVISAQEKRKFNKRKASLDSKAYLVDNYYKTKRRINLK